MSYCKSARGLQLWRWTFLDENGIIWLSQKQKLSKERESRKRENVAKTEQMFYYSYRQQTLEGKTMKGKEFDEKQVLIRCIAKKLETASLARVREIFIFVQYALK